MVLPNDSKTKKKIFDLMFVDCMSVEPFTFHNIKPYYRNGQWYVEVRNGLKRVLYKVIEENGLIKFNLIEFQIY